MSGILGIDQKRSKAVHTPSVSEVSPKIGGQQRAYHQINNSFKNIGIKPYDYSVS